MACGTWLKPKGNEDRNAMRQMSDINSMCGTWLKPKGNEDIVSFFITCFFGFQVRNVVEAERQ